MLLGVGLFQTTEYGKEETLYYIEVSRSQSTIKHWVRNRTGRFSSGYTCRATGNMKYEAQLIDLAFATGGDE